MKNKYLSLIATLLVFLTVTNSCKNPYDGVELKVDLTDVQFEDPKNTVMLEFSNMQAFQLSSADISISLIGDNVDKVFNIDDGSDSFEINEMGLASLSIMKADIPTSGLSFYISVEAEGYLPVLQPISVAADQEFQSQEILLYPKTNAPVGIIVDEAPIEVNASGQTTDDVHIEPEDQANNEENIKISIPTNTILLDSDGQPVTGDVKAEVAFYNPAHEEALAAFPGGLQVVKAEDASGNPLESGRFQSAGLVALKIKGDNNKTVKTFSQPIDIEIEINDAIQTPQGKTVEPGDLIPVWSLDEGSSTWVKEDEALVTINGDGKLSTTISIDHLSYWNLDYFWGQCANTGQVIFDLASDLPSGVDYAIKVSNPTGTYTTHNRLVDGEMNYFYNPPSSDCMLEFSLDGSLIHRIEDVNLCGTTQTLNVSNSLGATIPQPVSLTVKAVCPNNENISLYPYAYVYVKKQVTNSWGTYNYWKYIGSMTANGTITTTEVKPGETHEFFAYGFVGWRYMGYIQFEATVPNTYNIEKTVDIPTKYANKICE